MKDTDKVILTFSQLKRLIKESNKSEFNIQNGVLVKYHGSGGVVIIPDSVTRIGVHAFYNCKSLTSVIIPEGVTSIGDEAFWACTNLTRVTIPDSVTSIEYGAFSNCQKLTKIIVPDSVTEIGDYAFFATYSLKNISLPSSFECGENILKSSGKFLKINSNDGEPFSEDVCSKLYLYGINGLRVSQYDSYYTRCPEYVIWKGKEYHLRDIGGKISHYTIRRPLNGYNTVEDSQMLNNAKKADPKLFKKAMLQVLNGTKQTVWYDAVNDRWTSDEKMLKMKNRADAEWQKDRDMMNGL